MTFGGVRIVWRSPLDDIEAWKAHLLWRPANMGFVAVTLSEISALSLRELEWLHTLQTRGREAEDRQRSKANTSTKRKR